MRSVRSRWWLSGLLGLSFACDSSGPGTPGNPRSSNPDATVGLDVGLGADAGTTDAGGDANCAPLGTPLQMGAPPPRRGDMAFAYDPVCNRVFMALGDEGEPQMCGFPPSLFVDDFWVYEGNTQTWTQITADGPTPPVRARSVGAWDTAQNRFIVHSGRFRSAPSSVPYTYRSDVWAYDPSTNRWTELWADGAPGGPPGGMNATMVADTARNRVVVYGGGAFTSDFTALIPDPRAWAFDLALNTWKELGLQTQSPPSRLYHVAGIDQRRGRMYVFSGGGEDALISPTFKDDMWYLDFAADSWTRVPTDVSFPDGRIRGSMITDHARDKLVMFAGHDDTALGNLNDLWTFDLAGQQWNIIKRGDVFNRPARATCDFPADFTVADIESPERREAHLFVEMGNGKALLFGGRTDCGISNDTWELDLGTGTWTQINESFTAMTCRRAGRTDCDDPNADMCG